MEAGLIRQFEEYSVRRNIPEVLRLLTDPELPGLTHPDIEAGGAVKIDVLGDRGIFVVLQRVTTMVPEDTFFEAHRDHLDVHVPLEGAESIGYTPLDERLVPGGPVPVFQGDDVTYAAFPSDDDMSVVRLVEGMYALFGPDDVHMPKLQTDGPSPLRKVVVKVPVAPLPPARRKSAGRGRPGRLGAARRFSACRSAGSKLNSPRSRRQLPTRRQLFEKPLRFDEQLRDLEPDQLPWRSR